ncbi:MAG: efflux RND transporter periplasmic adaptor subunit [Acidobacteria bacterium]|nr:efflux RND transporter periplasmic adaptor subunit [Acidobacteriota bacterium]
MREASSRRAVSGERKAVGEGVCRAAWRRKLLGGVGCFVFLTATAGAQQGVVLGKVVPLSNTVVEVYAPATGRVIPATPEPLLVGDKVKKGDPLAIIEHRYNLHDWAHLSTVRWDYLSAVLDARYAALKTRVDREKAERLLQLGSASGQEVQALRAAEQVAAAGYAKAKALLDQQDSQIQMADLVRRGIFAPIAGDISLANYSQGQVVNEGFLLYRITNLEQVGVAARFPEADRRPLQNKVAARIRFDNIPGKTYSGRLEVVPPVVDPLTRVREVLFRVENPGESLRFGMIGEVEVVLP